MGSGATHLTLVEFFAGATAIPAGITGVAGTTAGVPAEVVRAINRRPDQYYVNLHTTEFRAGAIRGQLHRT